MAIIAIEVGSAYNRATLYVEYVLGWESASTIYKVCGCCSIPFQNWTLIFNWHVIS